MDSVNPGRRRRELQWHESSQSPRDVRPIGLGLTVDQQRRADEVRKCEATPPVPVRNDSPDVTLVKCPYCVSEFTNWIALSHHMMCTHKDQDPLTSKRLRTKNAMRLQQK